MTHRKPRFKIQPRHIAFVHAIVGGMTATQAYIEHMSPGKKANNGTARSNASGLMKRPEIQKVYEDAVAARDKAITEVHLRNIPKEFSTPLLSTDELDAYHSAIVLGLVDMEEYFQSFQWEEIIDPETNKIIKRVRKPVLIPIKRKPNFREKQISMDALYKRTGSYAPSKLFAAVGSVNDEGELENVERYVVYSTGEKELLLPPSLKKAQ